MVQSRQDGGLDDIKHSVSRETASSAAAAAAAARRTSSIGSKNPVVGEVSIHKPQPVMG
jgi:hypothetical protein